MRLARRGHAEIHARPYGELELLAGNTPGLMRTQRADLKFIRVHPGQATSLHRHLVAESIFHVVDGTCAFEDGGETRVVLGPGDTVVVDPGEPHQFVNVGDRELVLLEVESPPHDRTDKYLSDRVALPTGKEGPLGAFWADGPLPRVKVCGVPNIDAAILCYDSGVDAIGIHFVGSHRMDKARDWSRWLHALPDALSIFLLTDADEPQELLELGLRTRADTIQLQGHMPDATVIRCAEAARSRGWRTIKSVGVADMSDAVAATYTRDFSRVCDAVLFDSTFRGGTGATHDWDRARRLANGLSVPVILAGGLKPDNVTEAVATVQPYGVDVESGVEMRYGAGRGVSARSHARISAFMAALGRGAR